MVEKCNYTLLPEKCNTFRTSEISVDWEQAQKNLNIIKINLQIDVSIFQDS
jgi:hypothetical protein